MEFFDADDEQYSDLKISCQRCDILIVELAFIFYDKDTFCGNVLVTFKYIHGRTAYQMKSNIKSVTVLELKRLLIDLLTHQPNTCIRIRLMGEMWSPTFMKIVLITDKDTLLNDESTTCLRNIGSLGTVMQFELDQRFQSFQPHFHYDVIGSDEFTERNTLE